MNFPIYLFGDWRSKPGTMVNGKCRRGTVRCKAYWYIKAMNEQKQRKTRVAMLAQCYREDGHLRGEWG